MKRLQWRLWMDWAHRYLGLLIFAQVLLWSVGGMLMAGLNFSDLYQEPSLQSLPFTPSNVSFEDVQSAFESLVPKSQWLEIKLQNIGGHLVYGLTHPKGLLLVNADGKVLNTVPESWIREVAVQGYTGKGHLKSVTLLDSSKGNYYSTTPVYRADFEDTQGTEIYISPQSGQLLARRKRLWALYNWMWEMHLMKLTPWPKVNKTLLFTFAVLNSLVAITGFVKFFRWGFQMKAKSET